ncbi:cupin domain-containing protein [Rosettibacter firmus]|uniref:cupin domain-containing protein n=1 Tax=Rosettibacter firmus TaxID=3111522 RepID=UPI00336BF105
MKVINIKNVESKKVMMDGAFNAYKQIPISKADGTPNFSMRVFTIEPNGYTPYHKHNYEQLNYIIEGEGILINENQDEIPLNEGDFVLVLPNEIHQYKNKSSNKNFVFICCVPKEFE